MVVGFDLGFGVADAVLASRGSVAAGRGSRGRREASAARGSRGSRGCSPVSRGASGRFSPDASGRFSRGVAGVGFASEGRTAEGLGAVFVGSSVRRDSDVLEAPGAFGARFALATLSARGSTGEELVALSTRTLPTDGLGDGASVGLDCRIEADDVAGAGAEVATVGADVGLGSREASASAAAEIGAICAGGASSAGFVSPRIANQPNPAHAATTSSGARQSNPIGSRSRGSTR